MKNFKRFATAALFAAVAMTMCIPFARAQEEGDGGPGNLYMQAIMVNMRMDGDTATAIWWTNELWAAVAHEDKSKESKFVYQVVTAVMKDYLLFNFGTNSESGMNDAKFDKPVEVKNNAGKVSKSVKIHPALKEMLPNFTAVPRFDPKGADLIAPGTKQIVARGAITGVKKPVSFTWDLPLQYSDDIHEAVREIETPMVFEDGDEPTEDELMGVYLGPTMRVDIETGIAAFYMKPEMLQKMIEQKIGNLGTPEAVEIMKKVIANNDCFMVMDPSDNRERLKKIQATAKAFDSTGKAYTQDKKTYDLIKKTADPQDDKAIDVVVFPKIKGNGTYILKVMEPTLKKQAVFTWRK